ncbi:hypothetical protein [Paenibacillus sp. sgz302251]|uniref:hypothetical protein n=1 Tax=Paenibacillus sp. sgz302251 TaxID=3414493 RepID=UPI003C7ECD05
MKTQDVINQQAACFNANLFFSKLIFEQQDKITNMRAIGALITAYDKIGDLDALEVTALVKQFESQLNEISQQMRITSIEKDGSSLVSIKKS